jgi:hypothetical protein
MSNESPYDIFCVTFAINVSINVSLFAQKTVNQSMHKSGLAPILIPERRTCAVVTISTLSTTTSLITTNRGKAHVACTGKYSI